MPLSERDAYSKLLMPSGFGWGICPVPMCPSLSASVASARAGTDAELVVICHDPDSEHGNMMVSVKDMRTGALVGKPFEKQSKNALGAVFAIFPTVRPRRPRVHLDYASFLVLGGFRVRFQILCRKTYVCIKDCPQRILV